MNHELGIQERFALFFVLFIILNSLFTIPAFGQEFTSSNFKILNPVIFPGGYSTSQSYRSNGVIGQIGIGKSTSGNFQVQSGFLYYPAPAAAAGAAPSPAAGAVSGNVGGGGPILAIYKKLFTACAGADLNCDGEVDLEDASILLYWWEKPLKKPNFASLLENILILGRPSPDLNSDTNVNLFDLSILMNKWTP